MLFFVLSGLSRERQVVVVSFVPSVYVCVPVRARFPLFRAWSVNGKKKKNSREVKCSLTKRNMRRLAVLRGKEGNAHVVCVM